MKVPATSGFRSHTRIFGLGALLLATACTDSISSPAEDEAVRSTPTPNSPSFIIVCEDPELGCADNGDTHVSADVTFRANSIVTMNETFPDPTSGQMTNVLNVTPPDLHVHVEAGYTSYGAVKITTSYSDGADPTTILAPQVVRHDLTGNNLTDINSSNQALALTTPDSMLAAPIMNLVGSTTNADITAGVLIDISDTLVWSGYRGTSAATPSLSISSAAIAPAAAFARAERGESVTTTYNGLTVSVRSAGTGLLVVEDISATPIARMNVASSGPGGTSKTEKHTRSFKKDKGKWVLSEDRTESEDDDGKVNRKSVSVSTYSNVKWFTNAAKDSARRALRATSQWIPLSAGSGSSSSTGRTPVSGGLANMLKASIPVPSAPNRLIACDDACAGSGGSGGYSGPQPLGYTPPCLNDVAATVNETNASVNVLYQHGFASNAMTWCKMSEYVRERFMVGYELRHSLQWRSRYEDQASELEGKFATDIASRPGSYVLVGHSNGGIVSRYTAQNINDPSKVRGVVSISSPHAGAALANVSSSVLLAAVSIPLIGSHFGCDVADAYVCRHGLGLGAQVLAVLSPVLRLGVPVSQQMGTNNSFHNTINARGDAAYLVAGVQNRIWNRWTLWRVIGDYHQCDPQPFIDCDGYSRRYVNAVDKSYHRYINCSIVSGLIGIFWTPSLTAAAGCAKNAAGLAVIDHGYRKLSTGNAPGDGVVAVSSQIYPGAPSNTQFLVDDADSHIGVTKSRRTGNTLNTALNSAIRVPFAR